MSSEQEAAKEWKSERTPWAVRQGAHRGRELDQEVLPRSLNDTGMGQKVARVAIIAVESKGCRTSIVKEKIPEKLGHGRGGLHWVYEGRKLHAGTGQKSNRL